MTGSSIDETLDAFVQARVSEGFLGRQEIVDCAVDYMTGETPLEPDELQRTAELLTDSALARHLAVQAAWADTTDCDRLDAAFASLETEGIVARQNFACCQSCGSTEIGDEIAVAARSRDVIGYTFFHEQDTEMANEAGTLYLSYGAVAADQSAALGVGERIIAALTAAGLVPSWNGSLSTRIAVSGLEWNRRR